MQLRHPLGGATTQLDPEQLGQQAVVAVPLAPLVERRDEHVGPLDLGESRGRFRPVGQRVGERSADGVHDGRREHEVEGLRVERIEDLLHQVVEDVAVRCAERLDERTAVRSSAASRGRRGRARPASPRSARGGPRSRPGRGPARGDRRGARRSPPRVNARSAVRSSSSSPVARSRATGRGGSVRVEITSWTVRGASSANRVRAWWASSLCRRKASSRTRTTSSGSASRIRATAAAGSGSRAEATSRSTISAVAAERDAERGPDRRPEHGLVVVLRFDRDPCERSAVDARPVREQRRLAEPGRSDDQGQGGAACPEETREARPPDRAGPPAWRLQLRRLDDRPGASGCRCRSPLGVRASRRHAGLGPRALVRPGRPSARRARVPRSLPVDRSRRGGDDGSVRGLRVPVAAGHAARGVRTDVEHQRQHKPDGVDGVDAAG